MPARHILQKWRHATGSILPGSHSANHFSQNRVSGDGETATPSRRIFRLPHGFLSRDPPVARYYALTGIEHLAGRLSANLFSH
jgi:hypothetical protein